MAAREWRKLDQLNTGHQPYQHRKLVLRAGATSLHLKLGAVVRDITGTQPHFKLGINPIWRIAAIREPLENVQHQHTEITTRTREPPVSRCRRNAVLEIGHHRFKSIITRHYPRPRRHNKPIKKAIRETPCAHDCNIVCKTIKHRLKLQKL